MNKKKGRSEADENRILAKTICHNLFENKKLLRNFYP